MSVLLRLFDMLHAEALSCLRVRSGYELEIEPLEGVAHRIVWRLLRTFRY